MKSLLTASLLFSLSSFASETATLIVHVSQGKYSDYYHIKLKLNNSNFEFTKDESGTPYTQHTDKPIAYSGDLFEVKVLANQFSI